MSHIAPTAWVGDNAWIGDNAQVSDDAQVGDHARVGGNAWIGDFTKVGDSARIGGNTQISSYTRIGGDADLQSTHHYLTIGPIGTEGRYVTLTRQRPTNGRWGHQIIAGCWSGTCDELADRIADPYTAWPDASDEERLTARREYEAALVLMRARVATWEAEPVTAEDIARWADLDAERKGGVA